MESILEEKLVVTGKSIENDCDRSAGGEIIQGCCPWIIVKIFILGKIAIKQ